MRGLPIIGLALLLIVCSAESAAQPMTFSDTIIKLPTPPSTRVAQAMIVAFFFAIGACLGSFLNVVIYRMPAGMSLGHPKSRCPRCETPLAARDNIPVFGWILLRGRCRYCSLPIPLRYPTIEAVCGGILVCLIFGELLRGGVNLPLWMPIHFHDPGHNWLLWFSSWDLLGIYAYHSLLLILVLATVMIGYDGHPPQKKLTRFSIGCGLIAGTMWNQLRPVPAWPWPPQLAHLQWGISWVDPLVMPGNEYWTGVTLTGFLDGIAGIGGGLFVGACIRWLMNNPDSQGQSGDQDPTTISLATSFIITGAFLGWQACGLLGTLCIPVLTIVKICCRRGSRPWKLTGPAAFLSLLGFIIYWAPLNNLTWTPGYEGWVFTRFDWKVDWVGTAIVMFIWAAIVRMLSQRPEIKRKCEESASETS